MNSRVETILQKGKYRIDCVLGRGEFGITYRAIQTLTNQQVAIKTLNPNLRHHVDFAQFQHHFKAVAQRLSICQHPNLVRVLDGFEEKGLPFMVMDYIPGEPLMNRIHSGTPLAIDQAIHYVRQVATALKVVHQQGLIHCNLNLETIRFERGTDQLILTDFGIASRFTDAIAQPYLGSRSLSGGYAALEQYLPHEKLTPATDIYSLAAMFHCLLTTQPPLEAPLCLSQVNQTLLSQSKPSLRQLQPHLSPALEKVIMWGLELEQQHRPQTVEQWLAFVPEPHNSQPSLEVATADLNAHNTPLVEISEQLNSTETAPESSSPMLASRGLPSVVGLMPIFLMTALFSGWTGFNLTRLYGGVLAQKTVFWNQDSSNSEFPRNYDPSKPMFEDPSVESQPPEVVEDSERDFDYWDDDLANREIEPEENSQDQWSSDNYSSNRYNETKPYDLRESPPYSSSGDQNYNRYDSASELNSTDPDYSSESYSEPRDYSSEYPVNSTNSYSSDYQPRSNYDYPPSEAPLESEEYDSSNYPSEVTPSYSSPYQNSIQNSTNYPASNYPASNYSTPSSTYNSDSWESESQSNLTPEPSPPSEDTWSPSSVPSTSYSDSYPESESKVEMEYSLPPSSNSVPKFDAYPQTPLSESESKFIPADAT